MKISYKWLQDYLNIDHSPDKIAEILTDIGLEVEGTEEIETIKGGLKGVVIGEVLECEPHPNADKLKLTKVNLGTGEPVQIVCGAPNVDTGQRVPVATVGSTLYMGDKSLKIKKSKLRGEVSEGMICAEDELGLGDSHEGIMVLDEDAEPGTPASEYFKIESDYVFEIGLTPNRTDAISHYGMARDLKAALQIREGSTTQLNRPGISTFTPQNRDLPVEVNIEDKDACWRYAGVSLKGVKVEPSPAWMQNRLRAIGLQPINNIVDITNFVLHETGHPLHAFDLDKIADHTIVVKKLPEGTKFTTLDEKERTLSSEDLMICDAEKPLVIAGVFGGLDSGVTETTTDVFLESAVFNPVSIRKSAKRHALNTDASFRYERGIDPEMTLYALKRAAILIRELAGGEISMNIRDNHQVKTKNHQVKLSLERMEQFIGMKMKKQQVKEILQALEIQVKSESASDFFLEVPAYRHDVTREADVIEEVLRIYGYNNVEDSDRMQISISHMEAKSEENFRKVLSSSLVGQGFSEIMNNSLTQGKYFEKYGFEPNRSVEIVNPLSQDLGVLRQDLLFGGLESILYNINRQRPNLQFFEFGTVYSKQNEQYTEEDRLALWITGKRAPESWRNSSGHADFFTLKSAIYNLLEQLGIADYNFKEYKGEYLDYGLTIKSQGKETGHFGKVGSDLLKDLGIKQEVYYASLRWESLVEQAKDMNTEFRELARYPEVRRDLALLLDREVSYEELEQTAMKNAKKLLKRVNLFDIYQGKNLPENKKSYAMSFILQDEEQTLKDQQVDETMNKIIKAYQEKHAAELR